MLRDLNCDLGEGEPIARTRVLMRFVSSVNIACGGHAGNVRTMEQCVRLAAATKLRIGAHPGAWDKASHGRGAVEISPNELELLLLHQVSALQWVCQAHQVRLHHIKLHGTLYHLAETEPRLGKTYLDAVRKWWPQAKVYVRAGGNLAREAQRIGVDAWAEAFADRAYLADGRLVPRDTASAVISDPRLVAQRVNDLETRAEIEASDGTRLSIRAQTLCVHSDTPGAIAIAKTAARALGLKKPHHKQP